MNLHHEAEEREQVTINASASDELNFPSLKSKSRLLGNLTELKAP